MENTDDLKKEMRRTMRAELKTFCASSEYGSDSRKAAELIINWEPCRTADLILAFVSLKTEIDTHPLLVYLMEAGKKVAVPVTQGEDMTFRLLDNAIPLSQQLEEGAFSIEEPMPCLPAIKPDDIPDNTLLIVPGLAFSHKGQRLGKGKGYYDRYIGHIQESCRQKNRRMPVLAGYGFSFQVQEEVPCGPHDQLLDFIITEDGMTAADNHQLSGVSPEGHI